MGLTVKNKNSYELKDNLAQFFSIDMEEEILPDYTSLKHKINNSDLDLEEKANLINLINSLSIKKTEKEKKKIINEIDNKIKQYKLS